MMKFVTLLLALFAVVADARKPAFTTSNKLMEIRGGADLGPINADLLEKIGSASLALYVGGSTSKIIAAQSGSAAPTVAGLCTSVPVSTMALVNAIATAAYFICETGFGVPEMTCFLLGGVVLQQGLTATKVDQLPSILQDNAIVTFLFLVHLIVYFT